jgi:hypothetical protein
VANVLIDRYLPRWDVRERHEMAIQTPPEQAYRAVTDLDLGRSRLIRILFTIMGLPRKKAMTLDTLKSVGFVVLEEDPPTEIVLGLVGRFWRMQGGLHKVEATEFPSFADPGFVKAAWNFHVARAEGGSTVSLSLHLVVSSGGKLSD